MDNGKEDVLRELLRSADVGPRPSAGDLAGRVRRLARRRRGRRFAIGAVAACSVAIAAVLVMQFQSSPAQPTDGGPPAQVRGQLSPGERAAIREEIARVEAEIAFRSAGVERMLASERGRGQEMELVRMRMLPDPPAQIAYQTERAALIMVAHADHTRDRPDGRTRAGAVYRRAATLFPGTRGAGLARERLEQMEPNEGESL